MDMTGDQTSEREEDSGIESTAPEPADSTIFLRIAVPEFKVQKCLQFQLDDNVSLSKQRVLSALGKELKDGMNYGLYCPPMNGRAGKFLDEERPLRDYPMPGPVGFLELKYKRRVYKQMQVNPRKLKQLHTKANLKQFLDFVRSGSDDKITKLTNKGLDPNYYDHESGETPLTLAATVQNPRKVLLTLVSGGAHLDFRAKDGTTALHRAAQHGNYEAIKTLLDLGASPNYKDSHGLTPLYHAVCKDTNAHCVEILLHDHSVVGITDEQGWTEAHQACRYGRVQHLEHLVFYGEDMNVQNSGGNTPLHVAAVNNQESCVRVLLFRGADKSILNYANQDAFQVAVISGNHELAQIIRDFSPAEVVPFQEVPKYNEKRRTQLPSFYSLQRSRSDPRLNLAYPGGSASLSGLELNSKPPSPAMSNASLPQLISNGTGLFDPANAGMLYRRHYDSDSPRSMSISSTGSLSGSYNSDSMPIPLFRRGSCFELPSSSGSSSYSYGRRRLYPAMPGRVFICIKNHRPLNEAELALKKGQFVEVLSVGEQGYWEGKVGQREGWFPSFCVEEVRMRKKAGPKPSSEEESVLVKRTTLAALAQSDGENAPRTVVLQKSKAGFGFVLRGAKSQRDQTSTLEFAPTPEFPALQYLDRVDKGSAAEKAGLKAGDFLLEINGENVVNATHEHTVKLIKHSGDTLAMKVMTVKPLSHDGLDAAHMDGTRTLPMKKKEKLDHALAQYESDPDRHSLSNSMDSQQLNAMAMARGVDPNNKTASIRSRHSNRLTSVALDDLFAGGHSPEHSASNQARPVVGHVALSAYDDPAELRVTMPKQSHPENASNVISGKSSIRQSSQETQSRHITTVELRDGPEQATGSQERIYAVPYAGAVHKKYGSAENLIEQREVGLSVQVAPRQMPSKPSQTYSTGGGAIPPPPSHPPPTPPATAHVGEVVEISTKMQHMYANVSEEIQKRIATRERASDTSLESSFRPGTSARLSKVPAMLPPGVVAVQHSRTPSMGSSVSSMSDQSGDYHAVQGQNVKRGSFDRASSSSSELSSKASVAVSNAVRQEVHYASKYYEPEPDYESPDDVKRVELHRKQHKVMYSGKADQVSDAQISLQAKVPPPSDHSESVMQEKENSFNGAIKKAAIAREGRRNSNAKHEAELEKAEARQQKLSSVPPPPPLPKSTIIPPPPEQPTQKVPSASKATPSPSHRSSPPRQEGNDPHAALLAAIAQRRELVDNKNMHQVAGSIDDRVTRSKKMQSTVFSGDGGKKVDCAPSAPAAALLTQDTAKQTKVTTTTTKTASRLNAKAPAPAPPGKQPLPPPPSQPPPPLPPDDNSSQLDLLAMAELKRKEYLLKKAATSPANTLERPSRRSNEQQEHDEEEENKKKVTPPPPMPHPADHPRPKPVPVTQSNTEPDNKDNSHGLGNLASVVANRALQRQKSGGNDLAALENSQPKGSSVVYRSSGPSTNKANLDTTKDNMKISPAKAPVPIPPKAIKTKKKKVPTATLR